MQTERRHALCSTCAAGHQALLYGLAARPPEHGVTHE